MGLPKQNWLQKLFNNAPTAYEQAFKRVSSRFQYIPQPNEQNAFKIHRTALLNAGNKLAARFQGDCDDFAATLADYLISLGYTNMLSFLMIGDPSIKGKQVGHVAVFLIDGNNKGWVFDNMLGFVYPEEAYYVYLRSKSWSVLSRIVAKIKLKNSEVI